MSSAYFTPDSTSPPIHWDMSRSQSTTTADGIPDTQTTQMGSGACNADNRPQSMSANITAFFTSTLISETMINDTQMVNASYYTSILTKIQSVDSHDEAICKGNSCYFLTEIDYHYDDNQATQLNGSLPSSLSGEETHTSHHKNLGVLYSEGSGLGVLIISAKCNRSIFIIQSDAIVIVHLSTRCMSNCFFVLICAMLIHLFIFHLYYHLLP